MGKAGRWLKSFLVGKKDGGRRKKGDKLPAAQREIATGDETPAVDVAAASPREKKRWSFRRSSAATSGKPAAAAATSPPTPESSVSGLASVSERQRDVELDEQSNLAMAAAADDGDGDLAVEVAAAVRIQATYRGYLARKALCALRGLVKLQALIRGNLVRKQATATLRRMQALLLAQARLRAQRIRLLDEHDDGDNVHRRRRSPHHHHHHPSRRRSYEMEENVKVVEVDDGGNGETEAPRGRSSCSVAANESRERRMAEYGYGYGYGYGSPAPSSSYAGNFDDELNPPFEPATARSSPYVPPSAAGDFFPNYMANTQSSRAKARSQSAPRQRTDAHPPPPPPHQLERQPSRRRGVAGGGVPRSVKMQRSTSHIGVPTTAAHGYYSYGYNYPWSSASVKERESSECGSTTSSVLTAATTVGYCRSLVAFDIRHRVAGDV
uniref:DUF4005 domain-containing protein n=1 Tax=Leersia perrieri TaxID=77586 RepID=A0A0D9XJT1_9ORYZ